MNAIYYVIALIGIFMLVDIVSISSTGVDVPDTIDLSDKTIVPASEDTDSQVIKFRGVVGDSNVYTEDTDVGEMSVGILGAALTATIGWIDFLVMMMIVGLITTIAMGILFRVSRIIGVY